MPQLQGLRFDAIGHPDARLGGIRLNFCVDQQPTHTAIWLRNGGGKSSILSLLFTTLSPNLRDFLGGRGNQRRSLEDVVLPDDTGHVAAEWGLEDGRRIVTGSVIEKQSRRGELGRSELRRYWYAFRSDLGDGPTLDNLPVRDPARRVRRNMSAFLDALDEINKRTPACELIRTDSQSRWLDFLTRTGLDPELFRYQLEMNKREGGAEELFTRVATAADLVNLIVRLAMGDEDASRVSANIERYATELANKPRYELEAGFLTAIAASLEPLAAAAEDEELYRGLNTEARRDAARLHRQLIAAVAAGRDQAADARSDAEATRPQYNELDRRGGRLNELARELRVVAAEQAVAEAEEAHDALKIQAADAEREAVAWEAAVEHAGLRLAEAEAAEAQQAIDAAAATARPVRDELDAVGRQLAGMVASLEALDRRAVEEASHRGHDAAGNERQATTDARARATEAAGWRADLNRVRGLRAKLDSARAELVQAGALGQAEPLATALDRLAGEGEALVETIDVDEDARGEAEAAAGVAREEASRRRQGAREAERRRTERAEHAARLHQEANQLANETAIVVASGADPPVPLWALSQQLPALVRERGRQLGYELVTLEMGAASDRRAVASLATDRLLPARPDVEAVLSELHAAGVPAVSGWRWLHTQLQDESERTASALRYPELADGVILTDPSRFEAARRELRLAPPPVSSPITVAVPQAFDRDAEVADAAPSIVLPAPAALYDDRRGEVELAEREAQLAGVDDRRAVLEADQRHHLRVADKVDDFLTRCPAGYLDVLAQEIASLVRETADHTAAADEADNQAIHHLEVRQALEASLKRSRARQLQVAAQKTRIEALVAEESRLAGEPTVADLASRITAAQLAEQSAVDRADAARQAWTIAETDRLRATASAEERVAERGRIADELAGRLGDVIAADPSGYAETRQRFGAVVERYHGLISQDALAERKRQADRKSDQHRRELTNDRLRLFSERGADLANQVGGDPSMATDRRRRAADSARDARDEEVRAEGPVDQARQRVAALEPVTVRRGLLDAEGIAVPEDSAASDALANRLAEESTATFSQAQELRNEIDRLTDQAKASDTLATFLSAQGQRLADRIGPEGAARVADAGSPPWTAERATAAVDDTIRTLAEADDLVESAARRVGDALRDLRRIATARDYQNVKGRLRERLRDDDAQLAAHAAEYVKEAATRLTGLRTHLANLSVHEHQLVEELCGLVGTAQSLLHRSEHASRLPQDPHLEEWAGQEFLRLRFNIPKRSEGLADRMADLVAALVAEGNVPGGAALLEKAVHAAAGRSGFSARLLKPSATMERREVAVEEVATASGGERLTAALLLFFLLVRLRAPRFGMLKPTYTLFADNPIGTCSSVRLLDLQRRVADSFGVQLIYATGVNDLDALDMLPKVIRMRNEHVDPRTRFHHVTVDDEEIGRRRVVSTEIHRRPTEAT